MTSTQKARNLIVTLCTATWSAGKGFFEFVFFLFFVFVLFVFFINAFFFFRKCHFLTALHSQWSKRI